MHTEEAMPMERTTIFLEDVDRDAIRVIRKRWGTKGVSDTIRLALRAYAFGLQVSPLAPTAPKVDPDIPQNDR
jgi:hypothetical protein